MANIPVIALTSIASNNSASNWSPQSARRISLLDSTNPLFLRQIVLDSSGLICTRPNIEPVQLTMAAFLSAVGTANPNLTWPPVCTSQPSNSIVANYSPTGFISAYSAETAITYQWQVSINAGTNWTNIAAAGVYTNVTTNTLNISNTNALNGISYRVVAYNTSGNTASNLALLTVLPDPSIVTNPVSLSVTHPAGASFSVTAVGFTSLSYQWKVSTNGGGSFSNATGGVYSGDTTATLVISTSTGLNAAQYKCTVTDSLSNVTSAVAVLTVN